MTNSKRKGSRVELEAVHALKALGYEANRTQQYQGFGSDGDIAIQGVDLHTEVKGRRQIGVYDWIEQARRDARGKRPFWVIAKADRREFLAIMPLAMLHAVMDRLQEARRDEMGTETGSA